MALIQSQKVDYHTWVYLNNAPLTALPPVAALHCLNCAVSFPTFMTFLASLPLGSQAPGTIPGQISPTVAV